MPARTNDYGQPIGDAVNGWTARERPPRTPIEGRYCRVEPLEANALALAITMVFNFLANRAWTFRATRTSIRREAPRYLAIYLLGLVFATVALRVALEIVNEPSAPVETFLALAAGGAGTVTRYALLALLVYAPLPTARSAPETVEL